MFKCLDISKLYDFTNLQLLRMCVCAHLTILVEELMDGSLLRVKEQSGHIIVGLVGAEEPADGRVDVLTAGQLKKIIQTLYKTINMMMNVT